MVEKIPWAWVCAHITTCTTCQLPSGIPLVSLCGGKPMHIWHSPRIGHPKDGKVPQKALGELRPAGCTVGADRADISDILHIAPAMIGWAVEATIIYMLSDHLRGSLEAKLINLTRTITNNSGKTALTCMPIKSTLRWDWGKESVTRDKISDSRRWGASYLR